jgi:N-acetylglucosamine-6-sulfatase
MSLARRNRWAAALAARPAAYILVLALAAAGCTPPQPPAAPAPARAPASTATPATAPSSAPLAPPASQASRPPNIILILTDDQRYDSLRCTGHPFIDTPNIDRLAAEGALFQNAFVVTPLCAPSRASILTGQMTHVHGICNDLGGLPPAAATVPALLHPLGYATAFIGKIHLGDASGPPPGLFDYCVFARRGELFSHFGGRLDVNGRSVQRTGFLTDELTGYAVDWIHRHQGQPFFLMLALKNPHPPLTPPPRHAGAYADVTLRPPESYDDPLDDLPAYIRGRQDRERPLVGSKARQMIEELRRLRAAGEPLLEFARNTARMILSVDEAVGRIRVTLQQAGILDDTLIVCTSDNGLLIGEHGLLRKGLAYEPSIRVPLIMRYPPRIPGALRLQQQVLNIDIAPTMLDLAGAAQPGNINGRSLTPLFQRPDALLRSEWLCLGPYQAGGPGPPFLALRTDRWKYVRFREGSLVEQLFDLQSDPQERRNLAADPAHGAALADARDALQRLMREQNIPAAWWSPREQSSPDGGEDD